MTAALSTPDPGDKDASGLGDLTVQQFVEATGVTERTVRRHVAAGTLPYTRRRSSTGRPRILIPRSAVEPFIKAEDIPAAAERPADDVDADAPRAGGAPR